LSPFVSDTVEPCRALPNPVEPYFKSLYFTSAIISSFLVLSNYVSVVPFPS